MKGEEQLISGPGNEIRVFTGILIDPLNPHAEQIDIRDIAHALARMPRFAGHTPRFYSVAEHCLRCAQFCEGSFFELETLLHDAAEAYLMDIPKPIKHRFPDYIKAEKKLENCINISFGLYSVMFHEYIKQIDFNVLQEELSFLWNRVGAPEWYKEDRTFEEVEKMFLAKYDSLMIKRTPQ